MPNENTKKKRIFRKDNRFSSSAQTKKIFKENPEKGQEKPKNKTQCEKYKSIKPMNKTNKTNSLL